MKRMKRILAGLLAVGMMLAVVGCGDGGEEKTVTLRADVSDQTGIPTTDTMILTAKGDSLQQFREVMEIDLSDYDEDDRAVFAETYDSIFAATVQEANAVDGITASTKFAGTVYSFEFTVDCTNSSATEAAVDLGLITMDKGLISKLSLKATQSGLEASGYKVVE